MCYEICIVILIEVLLFYSILYNKHMASTSHGWNTDSQQGSGSSSFSKKNISSSSRSQPVSSPRSSTTRHWSSEGSSTSRKVYTSSRFSSFSAGSWGNGVTRVRNWTKHMFQSGQRWKPLLYIWGSVLGIYLIWVYFAVATQLPVITNDTLQNGNFSQTSTVSDRNGEVLYRFYEENREFVDFENIAPQAINAFVAMEDQSFWENGGVDLKWLLRNVYGTIQRALWMNARIGGASTITQQLLKNILALDKNESGMYDTIVRKHKEWLLVGKLADVIKSDVRKENPGISSSELARKQKERVMELYINFIYLGNQTHGIQAASQSYFAKSAKDLNIVESAILASMPQSPSYYDLYKNPTRVLWDFSITATDGSKIVSWDVYNTIVNSIGNLVFDSKNTISKSNNAFQNFTSKIVPENMTVGGAIYTLSYTPGRKDAVLNRMYEDGYITEEELKQSFIDGLNLTLASGKVAIQTPHFVFWVRDLLLSDEQFKDLEITEDMLYQWWLQIRTSLDKNIQDIAELAVKNNMPLLNDRGWNNRSMIHLDSTNGDVLAYVGSADYNNTEIQGQNDMVRSKRQPWSSVKPLVYAYFLQHVPSTLDTPVFDIDFTVWWLKPRNADGKFNGLMALKNALAYSRNIPAVKVYLWAWQEEKIKPFLQEIGLSSLKSNHEYGYSLALGAGEVSMLEMAQAYSVLSQLWEYAAINPILEIKDKNGNLIYEKKVEKKKTSLDPIVASMVWEMLSNTSYMPSWWVNYYTIKGLKYAVKSWTSNKVVKRDGEDVSLPRDGWLATYTPNRVTLYWAGNADDSPLNKNALWLLINSEVNKSFYGALLEKWMITNDPMTTVPWKSVTISKVTWRLANENTPEEYKVTTTAFNADIPWDGPYTSITVDASCGGKLSPLTPAEQRQQVYLFTPASITSFDTQDIIGWFAGQNKNLLTTPDSIYAKLFAKEPTEYCEGRAIQESDSVQVSTLLTKNQSVTSKFSLSYAAQSANGNIIKVTILANDVVVGNYSYGKPAIDDTKQVNLQALGDASDVRIQIVAVDETGKSNSITLPVKVTKDDTDKPVFDNTAVKVVPAESGGYEVTLWFTDATSGVESVSVTLPDSSVKNLKWSVVKFITPTAGTVRYIAKDWFGNSLEWSLDMSSYL